MDNERLKKLAGISTKSIIVETAKEITVNLGNRKFTDILNIKIAAKRNGGTVSVNESGNRFEVTASFSNTEESKKLLETFLVDIGMSTISEGAKVPQIDHDEYQKRLQNKSDQELEGIIKDAMAAIKANPDAPKSQGYYQDEINYARMELNKRKKSVKEGVEVVEEGEHNEKSEKMYALYVKLPDKDYYGIEFTDETSAACKQQWQDEKHNYGKGAKYKIVKVEGNAPNTLEETAENNFFQTVQDEENELEERTGTEEEIETKISVPAEVKKSVTDRIAELKAAHEKYDDKGYNDNSSKVKAITALEKIQEYLNDYTIENAKHCVIFYNTLMSPITDLFPAVAVNFILKGRHAVGLDLNNNFKLKPVDGQK